MRQPSAPRAPAIRPRAGRQRPSSACRGRAGVRRRRRRRGSCDSPGADLGQPRFGHLIDRFVGDAPQADPLPAPGCEGVEGGGGPQTPRLLANPCTALQQPEGESARGIQLAGPLAHLAEAVQSELAARPRVRRGGIGDRPPLANRHDAILLLRQAGESRFPLLRLGQALANPAGVGLGLFAADAHYRMICPAGRGVQQPVVRRRCAGGRKESRILGVGHRVSVDVELFEL